MKIIEFTPDGKPTTNPPASCVLEEAGKNELLREMLPVIFHKMKNKLTPVLGYTQILLSRTGDDFFKERLARIERNTAELGEELNTLKGYFKAGPVTKTPAAINPIIEDLAPCWQEISRTGGMRIVLELADGLPRLALNDARIRILLWNMVDNAAQALKDGKNPPGEIRLTTQAENSSLKLLIHDNGRGMSEEELASIWTPFYSKFPGHAGLGLVICERIIANHGAACSVASVPGEFSRFEIAFPVDEGGTPRQKKSDEMNSRSQS